MHRMRSGIRPWPRVMFHDETRTDTSNCPSHKIGWFWLVAGLDLDRHRGF